MKRMLEYKNLENRVNETLMMTPFMKKFRNMYACIGTACVIATYSILIYKSMSVYLSISNALVSVLPILMFFLISFAVVIANYVFILCLDIFDVIAHYLINAGRAHNKIDYE